MTDRPSSPEELDSAVVALTQLFLGPLAQVAFPGVDAAALQGAADSVVQSEAELETASAELSAAEASLLERQAAVTRGRAALFDQRSSLLAMSHQALAYARVYAKDEPALLARLETISLPKQRAGGASERRPRKVGARVSASPKRKRHAAPPAEEGSESVAAE